MEEIELRARLSNWNSGIELIAFYFDHNGKRCIAKNLEFCEVDSNAIINPTLDIDKKHAQVLMDDLWKAGLRPT